MPEKYEFARVTMPGFETLLPVSIYNEAIISLGILDKGIPCGVISASFEDFHFNLKWLYIDEAYRRKGYATALLTEMLSVIRESGETYPMQATFTSDRDDVLEFFNSYEHFDVVAEGDIYYISSDERRVSASYKHLAGIKCKNCKSFFQYDSYLKKSFIKEIGKKYPQFASLVEKDMVAYEPSLTLAYGTNNIKAAVFCKILDDRTIDISLIYANDAIATGIVLVALIKQIEKYYADYGLRIICVNDKSRAAVWKLFRNVEPDYLLQANWDLRLPGEYPSFNK